MSIRKKTKELTKLQKAFEDEADRFHDINLSVIYATQTGIIRPGKFRKPNHGIVIIILPMKNFY